MTRGREVGTSSFVCMHRKHVSGTVQKLVDREQILVHCYVVGRTVCKNSAYDVTLGHFVPAS